MAKSLKGTWSQAIITFFGPFVLLLVLRWALVEPFVVPSGSMIPNLQIHDHIIASKLSYGLHVPFSTSWLFQWSSPQRGDVAVFRYPKNPDVYYVKRIVGLPGDEIRMQEGELFINEQKVPLEEMGLDGEGFSSYKENAYVIRYRDKKSAEFPSLKLPPGMYFALGDNRDQSSDSRFWGYVPEQNFVGRVKMIWLSCEENLASKPFVCLRTIRWNRLLRRMQ